MQALYDHLKLDASLLQHALGLVAAAIAADIVPVTGENRILAFYGLKEINERPLPGIKTLLQLAGIEKEVTISHLVFVLAPRINAAGRMDDARKVIELLTAEDEGVAMQFAEQLNLDNLDRKEVDQSITEEALEMAATDPHQATCKTNVLYKESWHKGVVGIVASRVIEQFHKPTIILTLSKGLITGSARSVPGFDLHEAIYACREHLSAFGGHHAAAGLSMQPSALPAFKVLFEKAVASKIKPECLQPALLIDAVTDFSEITDKFYNILQQMQPYGPENLRPVYVTKQVADKGYSKIVKEKHIKFCVEHKGTTLTGIGFNLAHKFHLLQNGKCFDIVYTIDENEWNGTKTLQLKVEDIVFNFND